MPSKQVLADQDDGKSAISGIYRARVENNQDPTKSGKVQVRVPQFHGTEGSSNYLIISGLPWATPITPVGSGYDHGTLLIPDIGDYVFVLFENGDRSTPLYLGGCYGQGPINPKRYGQVSSGSPKNSNLYGGGGWYGGANVPEVPVEVYDENNSPTGKVVYKSPKGATILVQDKDESEFIQILDRIGQTIKMYSPVTKEANKENLNQRVSANADDSRRFPAMNPQDICVGGEAYIIIKDASGQQIKLTAKGGSSLMELITLDGLKIHLDKSKIYLDSNGSKIELTKEGVVNITNQAGAKVVLDKSGEVAVESKKIKMTSQEPLDINTDLVNIYGDLIVHSD